ncbi:hypothetical protein GOP47_0022509 [Adiantum capillus-veneris]|uniref:Protein ECERIFERUM 7 n=1 Tax=Adiantum capillus-veneris TaxID=13818 RepID=A0A9D4U5Z1_ADICA|nr:hypothetical protein GOP47_0022509 [Adiantum capillus-veneris]
MAVPLQNFIVAALIDDQRVDGRRPFDSRRLNIKFSREDGSAEVQLGQTLVMCAVSGQLVQPFPDRPNEGSLSVFTEFSPMADSTFEPGRQGENAVELGRVIDRGLRESRAVDTESLCVLAGKAVWSLRVDICILDNGGNLIDAASIAALAALLSFRRPECSTGGEDGQEIVIHPPEVREPLPLILHHLPIAVTFAFFGDGDLVVMDPSYKEELVMKGRLTVTMNVHGDICAVQKGGGVGVSSGEIMRCLRIASTKVADVTSSLKKAAEAHETERAFRKVKRHNTVSGIELRTVEVLGTIKADIEMRDAILDRAVKPKVELTDSEDSSSEDSDDSDSEDEVLGLGRAVKQEDAHSVLSVEAIFQGGASNWDEDTKPRAAASSELPLGRNPGKADTKSSAKSLDGKPASLIDAVKKNRKRKKTKKRTSKQS